MAKRILIFSTTYYPKHIGGAEVAIKEITDRISPDDYVFEMVTMHLDSSLPKVEKIGNVLVHRVGFTCFNPSMEQVGKWPLKLNKLMFPLLGAWRAHTLHKGNLYDGAWGMMATIAGFAAMVFKSTHKNVPYLLTLQEGDPIPELKRKVRYIYPLYQRIFTSADFIQAISTYLASFAKDMGFNRHVPVVPNGVNTAHFSQNYPVEELQQLKEKVGKKDGDKYIITTSRLAEKNAVDDVNRAMPTLPDYFHFLILGTGPDELMLRQLADTLNVSHRVKFLGQVDHVDMPKYLKISDVFIRPSRSEGFGNSFVEAMAAEIPVVATQEGGIADFLFDPDRNADKKTTGLAVDSNCPSQISTQLKRAVEDTELLLVMIPNAKKMVIAKYDWNIVAEKMKYKAFGVLLSQD